MYVILIKHLIAAKLNLLAGADGSTITDVISQTDMLIADGNGSRSTLEGLKDQLDHFNNTPCDETEPPTQKCDKKDNGKDNDCNKNKKGGKGQGKGKNKNKNKGKKHG